jgi:hypothetical protein
MSNRELRLGGIFGLELGLPPFLRLLNGSAVDFQYFHCLRMEVAGR